MKPEIYFGLFNFPDFKITNSRQLLIRSNVHHYYIIYKPYLVLSQFSFPRADNGTATAKKTLKDFFDVPMDVYPVGRLDHDSEGLLILTNDTSVNHRLLNPLFAHEREYWVQVEGDVTAGAITRLQQGVKITVDGKSYLTKKAVASKFETPPPVPDRVPPIRFRKNVPDSWIRLILTEGKNRQVRKMTASTGYPTLRLIRKRIAGLSLDDMQPGSIRELGKNEIYDKLFMKKT